MNRKNTAIGITLILLGICLYMRNFRIGVGSIVTLIIGLGLLFAYYTKREQPYMIFGGIFTAIGLSAIMRDIRLLRFDMSFEAVLIALGIILILLYYSRQIEGFVLPGTLLIALGSYAVLLKYFNDKYVSSSIFLLIGLAFYAAYFIAYAGKAGWPLVVASFFLIAGVLSYAFSFKIITWRQLYMQRDYIWPILMIIAGLLILFNKFRRKE